MTEIDHLKGMHIEVCMKYEEVKCHDAQVLFQQHKSRKRRKGIDEANVSKLSDC